MLISKTIWVTFLQIFGSYIKQLETRNMALSRSLCIVKEAQNKLKKAQGHIGYLVKEKCTCISEKKSRTKIYENN